MRLAIALALVLVAPATASAQTISVSGAGTLTAITTGAFPTRAVLEARSFALNVAPDSESLVLGEGCQHTGVPAFNPIGAPFRYGCLAEPDFLVTLGAGDDIVVKNRVGLGDVFSVAASLGAGSDSFLYAGVDLTGTDTIDGGSGRDGLSFALCQCPSGVTASLGNGFEALVGSPGPDTLTGLPEGATADRPQIEGAAGNDTITAVNGIPELIFCGPGNDHAIADVGDGVSADCERIDRQAGAPVISSGPSGIVAGSTARFEFALVGSDPPPGRFECALDGGSFTPCVSPVELSGLAEGERRFAVRYHADGADPGPAAERVWTVDTVAPQVIFDAAPAGEGNPAQASIAFHSSEPEGATFQCSLDAAPVVDCSSPHPVSGLAAGPHSFTVQTTDRAGNTSVPATATWVVGAAAPPQTAVCAPGTSTEASVGVVRLVSRGPGACFVPEAGAQVSRGPVTLNGISLTPAPGTRIIVSDRLGGGVVRTDGPVVVGLGSLLSFTLPTFELENLLTAANAFTRTVQVTEGLLQAAGLRVIPAIGLEFGSEDGGRIKATVRVTLPRAFRRLPGGTTVEGITAELSPIFSNDRGVTGAARLKVGEAYLRGKVKLKDIDLAFDFGAGVFDGSFGMALSRAAPGLAEPTITGSLSLGPTSSACGLRRLGLQASSLNRHVGYGVFVQRLGGNFECVDNVTRLSANGGVSLGPRIALGSFETEAISVDGNIVLTIPTGEAPVSLEIAGAGKIVDVPVTQQTVKYTTPAQLEIGGSIDLTIAGFGARLEQRNTWGTPDAFNVEALGQVNFFGLQASAEGVFSSTGYAVCLGRPDARFGFGKEWFAPVRSWSSGCDVGPFRTSATASQAGTRTFRVDAGRKLVIVAARGDGAPPKIELRGPGRTIRTPGGPGALNTAQAMLAQDTATNTTYVALFSPPAGAWRVTGATSVSVADGLPPVRVTARVRRGVLTWSARGLVRGQRLQFAERARAGEANVLLTTRRARGRLRFTPDPTLGTRRRIDAIVINAGTPRATETVARYRVAAPGRPGRVRSIRLRSRTLTWKRDRRAVGYIVAVTLSDGTTSTDSTRRPWLRVPRDARRVTIVAENAAGRIGPATTERLPRRSGRRRG
jgi:hypothetical protein